MGNEPTLLPPALTGSEPTLLPPALTSSEPTQTLIDASTPVTLGRSQVSRPATSMHFDEAWHLQGRKGPHTGVRWGDFELGGVLGEGGMGAVYRALQTSLRRRVALKVLPPALAQDEHLLARFRLEAATASKIQSPHVVQVYAIGDSDGHHWYAMEFVDGQDLRAVAEERVAAEKPLSADEAAAFILQAAKGLAEAGRLGVVHRDIKPANLMITRDGLLKIADFGLVKVLGEQQLTLTGQSMGTPSYVSPEQGSGSSAIDVRSDIYSLGVVFYELACGRRPFTGSTPGALIYQHCYEEPPLPTTIVAGFPGSWQAVILKCLQKKLENRYQNAEELVRDIEAVRHGQMIALALAGTGADEARREHQTWLQRNVKSLAIAAVLVAGASIAGGWWWLQQDRADRDLQIQVETRAGPLRSNLATLLDPIRPLPDGVAGRLDELARLVTHAENDADLQRWRSKIAAVGTSQERIASLVAGADAPTLRAELMHETDRLAALVGEEERSVRLGRTRIAGLDAEMARLRAVCIQAEGARLRKGDRDHLHGAAMALAVVSGPDDTTVVATRRRIEAFDASLDASRARIAPLDRAKNITESERAQYNTALADIAVLLDQDDPDVRRWRQAIDAASTRISALRERIQAVVGRTPEVITEVQQQQISADLAAYRALMGDNDTYAKDWQAAITLAEATVAACSKRLSDWTGQVVQGVLPVAIQEPFARDLARLQQLRLPDAHSRTCEAVLRDSQRITNELTAALAPFAAAKEITCAIQVQLRTTVDRLVALGGLEASAAEAHRARLATEAARVAGLRSACAGLDQVQPIVPAQREALARLTIDAGADDRDVARRTAKLTRTDDLAHRLGALDRQEPTPTNLDQLFTAYAAEVGPHDPRLLAWRDTVERIVAARKTLTVLDRRVDYDEAEIDAALQRLAKLVAPSDSGLTRWRAKADEVRLHHRALVQLAARPALGEADDLVARQHMARLTRDLTGSGDPVVRAAAIRLAELAGPGRPAWASAAGRDRQGAWAEASMPGGRLRFRWIAPGTVTVGSPEDEPGRDSDELRVALTLPSGCWLAETELPRAIWMAVMGSDPSRGPSGDAALMPVDRVSWQDAQEFCRRLADTLPARLPLEAEWEWACRAGASGPWCLPAGEAPGTAIIDKLAWTAANSDDAPHAVRERLPNAAGLYDLHGNLAEWCADAYGPYPTTATTMTAPASGGGKRVLRGGGWADAREKTRAANRIAADPALRSPYAGVRLAVEARWDGPQAGDGNQNLELHLGRWRLRLDQTEGVR